MQIIAYSGRFDYIAETQDWRLSVSDQKFEIVPIATGGLVYASGANLDHLAALIVEAKAHAISHNINWSGA